MREFNVSKKVKIAALVAGDILSIAAAFILSHLIVDIHIKELIQNPAIYLWITLINTATYLMLFAVFRLYTGILKYEGLDEFIHILITCLFVLLMNLAVKVIFKEDFSFRWAVSNAIFVCLFTSGSRFGYRIWSHFKDRRLIYIEDPKRTRVMVVGAGDAGTTVIREMQTSDKVDLAPVCIIDDDVNKIGSSICGVMIVGGTDTIVENAKKFDVKMIIIAIPSAGKKRVSEIIKICSETKCNVKIIPGMYQFITGKAMLQDMRDVDVKDLLGRDQVVVNTEEVMGYIKDRVIMVTGGGGSIGSELCRQIAAHNPKRLIIVDCYENNEYEIQMELMRKYPDLDLLALIANIREAHKVDDLFDKYRPEIVFHAAAHKHVPLMEVSPCEAIKNNVQGTYNLIKAADKYGVKRFVQISTDKAVNPTSLMGATKRICEMMIQTMGKHSETEFVAVRFGNVLGSNGSVIPLFKEQIKEGGPVTVTHKDIIRYFMTIPEAVSLVLQAGAYAKGGEIYVLNMGEPVRIYDMAVNLIKLSGLEPGKDIEIKITGLRPGEKLYEERLMAEEGMQTTPNNLINIGKPIVMDEQGLWVSVEKLSKAAYDETAPEEMKRLVTELVPTYHITNN